MLHKKWHIMMSLLHTSSLLSKGTREVEDEVHCPPRAYILVDSLEPTSAQEGDGRAL